MLHNKIAIPALFILALLQLYVPLSMIWDNEEVLKMGKEYKFRTQPVDPNDPFRGKYISLNFRDADIKVNNSIEWKSGEEVYVLFNDSTGFAIPKELSKHLPDGNHYLKASVDFVSPGIVYLAFPFERFYMEEYQAPVAEKVYIDALPDTSKITYALVNIYKGNAVLKDVIIGDSSIVAITKNRQLANK